MAIVTLKPPFKTYRGAVAFPHHTGGIVWPIGTRHFRRMGVIPANPKSDVQVQVRAAMAEIAQAWQEVTDGEAAGWETLAAAMSPRLDPDKNPYDLRGQWAYMIVNSYRKLDAQAIVDTAPAYSLPLASLITEAAHVTGTTTFTITVSPALVQTGFALVEISRMTYSIRRQARANEVVIPTYPTGESVATTTSTETTITFDTTDLQWAIATTAIYGIKLTFLDANYVPGQTTLKTLSVTVT